MVDTADGAHRSLRIRERWLPRALSLSSYLYTQVHVLYGPWTSPCWVGAGPLEGSFIVIIIIGQSHPAASVLVRSVCWAAKKRLHWCVCVSNLSTGQRTALRQRSEEREREGKDLEGHEAKMNRRDTNERLVPRHLMGCCCLWPAASERSSVSHQRDPIHLASIFPSSSSSSSFSLDLLSFLEAIERRTSDGPCCDRCAENHTLMNAPLADGASTLA